jgi:hypothetical protein
MAWGDKKKTLEGRNIELETENKLLQGIVEDLREEKRVLVEKLDKAYEALTAKEAPIAYGQMRADQAEAAMTEEELQRRENSKQIAQAHGQLLTEIEGPLFRGAEDMRSILLKVAGPPKIESMNYDDES